jgi:hypothetical protein
MNYYVPVGPLGPVFRFGTVVTGALGWLVYWRASRRRTAIPARLSSPGDPLPRAALEASSHARPSADR